ncbi:hypothetical protein NHE_0746 [Neorickettsia helminthoeca str. Oregon]|uniref:Uncharacterized protein n=1 Tax=Neorickettsia helminthoeca str. Oregon TaxID=1286528 RepID=X5H4P2_9RICK|nr:hypothetical protein [Neorickettsia helminthoeca]AHX11678.1 hypothetical protein NHE_0746 [Neorickettsia helminthoeca str. Oregon]
MAKHYLKHIVLLSSILLLCFVVFHYTNQFKETITLLKINQWEVSKQRSDIDKMKAEIKKLITEDSLATQVIFSNSVENLTLLFELIRDDYELENYNFQIENSEKIEALRGSAFYDVIVTQVSLSFSVDSKMKFYMFLDELVEKIPGHVYVKSITFATKERELYTVLKLEIYTLKMKHLDSPGY